MKTKHENEFSYHGLSDVEKKNLSILELIRRKEPISRTDISKITGLNIVSVSNYIKEHIDKHLVLEKGLDVSTGGRKPELLELNRKGAYLIGLGMDRRDMALVLTDLALEVIEKVKILHEGLGIKELADKLAALVQDLIKRAKIEISNIRILGLGLLDIDLFQIRDSIEKNLGIATYFAKAAVCAAFGERRLNAEAEDKDLLYIYSDKGEGVFVKEDACFCGDDANLGGYDIPKEKLDNFSKGIQYLSPWGKTLAMAEIAIKEVKRGVGTKIVDIVKGRVEDIREEAVIEAARENDEVASDIIYSVGMNLGIRIAYLVNLFNPSLTVIGGGVEKAGDLIMGPVRKTVDKFVMARHRGSLKIIPSVLGEDAVSLGAASLAAREIFLKA